MKRFGLFVLGVLSFAAIAGCSKSPVISLAPPPPNHLYVADSTTGFIAYSQPLSSASTPAFTIADPNSPSGLVVDHQGSVYVAHFSLATIDVYHQPITATSTPAFTIGPLATSLGPTVKVANISGMSFDAAGNLWAAGELGNQVYQLTPPFAAGPVIPQFFNSTSFNGPDSVVFDNFGHMIVSQFAGANVLVFQPPFAFGPNNVPAATLALPANASGIAMTVKAQLMVGLNDGRVAVFNPPFATGNTPAFFIPAPALGTGTGLAARNSTTDAAGNLYVPYASTSAAPFTGGIGVFAPPFSGASTPVFTFTSGMGFPYSLGFAP